MSYTTLKKIFSTENLNLTWNNQTNFNPLVPKYVCLSMRDPLVPKYVWPFSGHQTVKG